GLAELEHCDRYVDTESMDAAAAPLPAELRLRLARRGVTRITARLDGYGDSGQVEDFTVEPEAAVLGSDLEGALEDLLLGQLPGGWENDEGGCGEFTVDVEPGQAEVDASWRLEKDAAPHTTRWRWRQ